MIPGFFLNLLYYFLSFMISILPVGGTLPQSWVSSLLLMWGYAQSFSYVIPISTLLTVLSLAMTFHISIFAFRLVKWLVHLIRGN